MCAATGRCDGLVLGTEHTPRLLQSCFSAGQDSEDLWGHKVTL